jgi:hypothetical protein
MHLLTWVGFGLIGYVPNTLYKTFNMGRLRFVMICSKHLVYECYIHTLFCVYGGTYEYVELGGVLHHVEAHGVEVALFELDVRVLGSQIAAAPQEQPVRHSPADVTTSHQSSSAY